MQRLEELMKWQLEQQEKLSQHQQEQKELLSQERKRLCEAFGLDEQDVINATCNSEKVSVKPKIVEEKQNAGQQNYTLQKCGSQELAHSQVSDTAVFDETPIIQPMKNFHELLQEKLTDDSTTKNVEDKDKPKRKFLRKGEGLARFRMNPQKKSAKKKDDKTAATNVSNVAQKTKSISKTSTEEKGKRKLSTKKNVCSEETQRNEHPILAQWIHNYQSSPKRNKISDFLKIGSPQDKDRSKREQEELQVFELLEQHAANSSFCSTSSLVARLMGDSIASTPVKADVSDQSCKRNLETALLQSQHEPNILHSMTNLYNAPGRSGAPMNIGPEKRKTDESSCLLQRTNKPKEEEKKQFSHKPELHNLEGNSRYLRPSQETSMYSMAMSSLGKRLPENAHMSLKNAGVSLPCSSEPAPPNEQTCKPIITNTLPTPVEPREEFHDSQAWSDCSCSSCEEGGSHNSTLLEEEGSADAAVQTVTASTSHPPNNPLRAESPHLDIKEGIVFKSSLLKERLAELENEIKIFKKENANFSKLRMQHEEEVAKFLCDKKQHEKILKEKTDQLQENIQEERRKLAKEKQVFEKYCKGIKDQPSRQEREEIQALKQQVSELKEELIRKDKRWSASQIRTRDRVRQLTKQVADLKEENEKLKADKAKIKKVRFSSARTKYPNTKILHAVNNELGKLKLEDFEKPVIIKNVIPRKCIPSSILSQSKEHRMTSVSGSEWAPREIKYCTQVPDLQQKCNRENSSRGITDYIEEDCNEDNGDKSDGGCSDGSKENYTTYSTNENIDINEETGQAHGNHSNTNEDDLFDVFYPTSMNGAVEINSKIQTSRKNICPDDYLKSVCGKELHGVDSKKNEPPEKLPFSQITTKEKCDIDHAVSPKNQTTEKGYKEINCADGTREKIFDDGRREIWYPNGNLRKVSADKLTTKIIYYNGDVKEKFHADGTERYYYAETKTWHTSYDNGLEILEFPNGQVERRNRNGASEICYPNGCKVVKHTDGKEDWTLADGTVIKVDASGCKEIILPNGQKEIHTKEHKRREYPDGTVKFVYNDGVQETRYADGRIRLKDKDGNLVMDSAHR